MKGAYGIDVPVCRLGVNTDDFKPLKEIRREQYVFSVGEISPRKGYDFLIKSLGYIPKASRPKLRIACNMVISRFRQDIEQEASTCGVELEILTDLNTEELRVEYNRAAFCVYAPVFEPFGLVPLEAMACGTAVIGVKEGGVSESIIHNRTGILVEREVKPFAEAVEHLLSNPTLAEEFGENAREHILENWTWEASTAQLEDYLVEYAGYNFRDHYKTILRE